MIDGRKVKSGNGVFAKVLATVVPRCSNSSAFRKNTKKAPQKHHEASATAFAQRLLPPCDLLTLCREGIQMTGGTVIYDTTRV